MSQPPIPAPRPRPLASPPRLPEEPKAAHPPPVWHELAPEAQRQLAQAVAELLRRRRHPQQPEGSGHE